MINPTDPTQLSEQVATETVAWQLPSITPLPEDLQPDEGVTFIYVGGIPYHHHDVIQLLGSETQLKRHGRYSKRSDVIGPVGFCLGQSELLSQARSALLSMEGKPYTVSGLIAGPRGVDRLDIKEGVSCLGYEEICLEKVTNGTLYEIGIEIRDPKCSDRVRRALGIFEYWVQNGYPFGRLSMIEETVIFNAAYILAGRELGTDEFHGYEVRVGVLAQADDGSNQIRWLSKPNSTEEGVDSRS